MSSTLTELQARRQIQERTAHAAAPRLPSRSRHQLAARLRRVADRLES